MYISVKGDDSVWASFPCYQIRCISAGMLHRSPHRKVTVKWVLVIGFYCDWARIELFQVGILSLQLFWTRFHQSRLLSRQKLARTSTFETKFIFMAEWTFQILLTWVPRRRRRRGNYLHSFIHSICKIPKKNILIIHSTIIFRDSLSVSSMICDASIHFQFCLYTLGFSFFFCVCVAVSL